MRRQALLAGFLILAIASTASAHYNMLLCEPNATKRGEAVTLLYQWGHPYEHQLFEAPRPLQLIAIAPNGQRRDLLGQLEPFRLPASEGKSVTGYHLRYTPGQRGDTTFWLRTPAIWLEEEQEYVQDTVKTILHVQTQRGWDQHIGEGLEVVPLTRPYGIQPGMAFQVQVLEDGRPLPGALAEVEHYHPEAPARLPPDEHITRSARSDPNGCAVATLTEPGWWCVTATGKVSEREHEGKKVSLRHRSTLWVFVDGAILFTPAK